MMREKTLTSRKSAVLQHDSILGGAAIQRGDKNRE
jgi:hypothetical protein